MKKDLLFIFLVRLNNRGTRVINIYSESSTKALMEVAQELDETECNVNEVKLIYREDMENIFQYK